MVKSSVMEELITGSLVIFTPQAHYLWKRASVGEEVLSLRHDLEAGGGGGVLKCLHHSGSNCSS